MRTGRALWAAGLVFACHNPLAAQSGADSISIAARFMPPKDAFGRTVAAVQWRLFQSEAPNRQELRRGTTRLDTLVLENGRVVIRWRVRTPLPDEMLAYSFSLRSVDSRGIGSAEVYSGYLRVTGEWGPGLIPMDIYTEMPSDSIQIISTEAEPFDTIRVRLPTDTLHPDWPTEVQLCLRVRRNGVWYMARDLHPSCYQRVSFPTWRAGIRGFSRTE